MSNQPLISVAIPAYKARNTLRRAVASVLNGGLPAEQIQIVVASDDGHDYASYLTGLPSVFFTSPGPIRTGVGPARNRAMSACTGQFMTYLDADDHWAPGLLKSLLPALQAIGIACPPTEIRAGDDAVLTVPSSQTLTFPELAKTGASFRPIFRRDLGGPFRNALAQDIFHLVELMGQTDGTCPVGDVPYFLELGTESVSAASDYADRLVSTYSGYARDIRSGKTLVKANILEEAAQVFDAKLALNEIYMRDGAGRSYYQFIADSVGA